MKKVMQFLRGLIYENGQPSRTGLIGLTGWLAFLIGSFYLLVKGQRWDNYETFATFTAGGGALTQIANKYINSKLNSPADKFPNKGDQQCQGQP